MCPNANKKLRHLLLAAVVGHGGGVLEDLVHARLQHSATQRNAAQERRSDGTKSEREKWDETQRTKKRTTPVLPDPHHLEDSSVDDAVREVERCSARDKDERDHEQHRGLARGHVQREARVHHRHEDQRKPQDDPVRPSENPENRLGAALLHLKLQGSFGGGRCRACVMKGM